MSSHTERPPSLDARELKGSRLFCLWLTSGSASQVASRLEVIVGGHAQVPQGSIIMPRGPLRAEEAQIGRSRGFLSEASNKRLSEFWLANVQPTARLPTWDLAATCTIKGKQGLMLCEAKAHSQELDENGKRFNATSNLDNHDAIGAAIQTANSDLNERMPHWGLSRDHHCQLSNRFTWAWKLAALGVPVVLVFLGISEAKEMNNGTRRAFVSHDHWKEAMLKHSTGIVPADVWGQEVSVGEASVLPLIRSVRSQFLVGA